MSSKSEGFWYPKPSTGNFQVVITRMHPRIFVRFEVDNHLAGIRAEDVVAGLKRMPVGFYILVRFDDTKLRTENKPVRLHDRIVEWDDRIQLWDILYSIWFIALMVSRPSEPSAKVELSVCASFEFSPILGNGEVLRTVEICVGELIDNTHSKHCTSHALVARAEDQYSSHVPSSRGETWIILFFAPSYHRATAFR